ncbi:diphosphomevalonate decarboxylase [Ornithinimicrobium avium]|uniref:diphosphomevalonate decarboxylase n=1 Tax=Ornithinimicrobium avium TaxID=2283195 RepID=A0A345NIT6_9MICO|nr:diphosphomevalonate decarboxylase [Ornithinimicrobium avium]AXH94944.1 diphosphomevalonate decarboxylase [Ornithinimicrobium avium]
MSAVTARAHPNIALIKYWGKKDEELILPVAGSLSLTLDAFATTTSVELREGLAEDRLELDGLVRDGEQLARVSAFLDHVRSLAGASGRAVVRSVNEAPTAAGLASSASGFAALAMAASAAYGLDLDARGLSRLARRGSGSAARSLVDGVAVWHAGTDDESSYAEAVPAPPMGMVIATVDGGPKAVSSREAMRRTVQTSPYFSAWVSSTEDYLERMVTACRAGDFTTIGQLTEAHALRMHALIASTEPPIRYLRPRSVEVFDAVAGLREDGVEAWATADAGPNVAVLVQPQGAAETAARLAAIVGVDQVRVVGAGPGAHLLPEGCEVPPAPGTGTQE